MLSNQRLVVSNRSGRASCGRAFVTRLREPEMTALDPSKPKNRSRPLLRFSLRAMLLVLTASALWLGWKADRVHRQKQAVGWLRPLCQYD